MNLLNLWDVLNKYKFAPGVRKLLASKFKAEHQGWDTYTALQGDVSEDEIVKAACQHGLYLRAPGYQDNSGIEWAYIIEEFSKKHTLLQFELELESINFDRVLEIEGYGDTLIYMPEPSELTVYNEMSPADWDLCEECLWSNDDCHCGQEEE